MASRHLVPYSLILTGLVAGCAPHVPYQTYQADLYLSRSEQAEQASQVQLLNDKIGDLLHNDGLTVAFFPPDDCRNTSATPLTSQATDSFLSMSCGPLISALERSAATRGYEVVSWQFIKHGDAVQKARDNGVDLIFEVDQLSTNQGAKAVDRVSRVDFVSSEGYPLQIANPQAVGQRCVELAAGRMGQVQGDSVTMAVKAVDVGSGRALWYYSKTMGDSGKEDRSAYEMTYWPKRRFERGGMAISLWLPGILAFAGGLAGTAVGLADGDLEVAGPWALLAAAGGGLTAGGLIWAYQENHPKRMPLEDPDQVLCNPQRANMPDPDVHYIPRQLRDTSYTAFQPEAGAYFPQPQQTGSSFTMRQSQGPQEDTALKRKLQLVELAVEDLFSELGQL